MDGPPAQGPVPEKYRTVTTSDLQFEASQIVMMWKSRSMYRRAQSQGTRTIIKLFDHSMASLQ